MYNNRLFLKSVKDKQLVNKSEIKILKPLTYRKSKTEFIIINPNRTAHLHEIATLYLIPRNSENSKIVCHNEQS